MIKTTIFHPIDINSCKEKKEDWWSKVRRFDTDKKEYTDTLSFNTGLNIPRNKGPLTLHNKLTQISKVETSWGEAIDPNGFFKAFGLKDYWETYCAELKRLFDMDSHEVLYNHNKENGNVNLAINFFSQQETQAHFSGKNNRK